MQITSPINTQLIKNIKMLPDKHKREVLRFIEYLKMRDDASFIAYVNERTLDAIQAKKSGEHFSSLDELQKEYASAL